jgi:hypothetical protein
MRAIRNLLESFLAYEGVKLPPWALPAVILALVVLFWPLIRRNHATGDARKLLKEASRTAGAERERLEGEALAKVEQNPTGLVVLAEEAMTAGRTKLAERAVEALRATRKRPDDVARLTRRLEGPQPANAIEAAIVIERLLTQGMRDEARARLAKWRKRWPEDTDLGELERRVAE